MGRPKGGSGAGVCGQGPNSGYPGEARENGTESEMISGHNQPVLVTVCMMRKAGEEKGSGMGPDLSPSVRQ